MMGDDKAIHIADPMHPEKFHEIFSRVAEARCILVAGLEQKQVEALVEDAEVLLKEVERARHGIWETKQLMAAGKHEEAVALLEEIHPKV